MQTRTDNPAKVYVRVSAVFDENGAMYPRRLLWEDGTIYTIDRITDLRQAAARKAGGQGDRYTILVNGHKSYLFFERLTNDTGNTIGRWFVERKGA